MPNSNTFPKFAIYADSNAYHFFGWLNVFENVKLPSSQMKQANFMIVYVKILGFISESKPKAMVWEKNWNSSSF